MVHPKQVEVAQASLERADLFGDPTYDRARQIANEITDYMRQHGPFMPYRLGPEEVEYTTLPEVLQKLKDRFKK